MRNLMSLLIELARNGLITSAAIIKLAKAVAQLQDRQYELENKLATVDQEMRDRLDAASSRVAARLDTLIDKVSRLEADQQGAVDAALLADAQADADALRPSVEYLERLGGSDSEIVPETDPIPSENSGVEGAPVVEGPSPIAPSEGPLRDETETESDDVAENDTATDDNNGNNTNN